MSNQEILMKFKRQGFPEHMINTELPQAHRDLLFEMSSNTQKVHEVDKNFSMSDGYVIDGTKHKSNRYQWKKPIYTNQTNSKPNTEIKKVIENLEMSVEHSFTVQHAYVYLNEERSKFAVNAFESMCIQDNEDINTSRIFTDKIRNELDNVAIIATETNNYNFTSKYGNVSYLPVNIKQIYKINEKLKYPRDDPLWYIFHSFSKSSFGPISSIHLEEIYNRKQIDGNSDVRLIDIFKLKNKGPFAYFQLKEVCENQNFLRENVEQTSLLSYVDELDKIKKDEPSKVEILNVNYKKSKKEKPEEFTKDIIEKYKTKSKQLIKHEKRIDPEKFIDFIDLTKEEDVKEEVSNVNQNSINKNNQKTPVILEKEKEKLNPVPIKNNIPSIIDEEYRKEKKDSEVQAFGAKKKGKKKGKLVDLDIKTGFYTLSQQEKNYEPIYICGEKEEQN